MPNDHVADEIKFHEETIASDSNSPLHLIREKEMEISGRMLAAKRQADEILAEARKKAAEIIATAEAEGGAGAKASVESIASVADAEAVGLRSQAQDDAGAISVRVEGRKGDAVRLVLDAVTTV